jgi:rubrerythrin
MNDARDDNDPWDADQPGDPACWLKRVCPRCGTLAAADPPTSCPQCHADLPAE